MSRKKAADSPATIAADELFEMANLYPRTTGLPMTVLVSPRGNARHDVRIKVNMSPGDRMSIDNTAVVAVRPRPHVIEGRLSFEDERVVAAWIELNAPVLVEYWNGAIDTLELVQRLKRLPAGS
ncbi:MAG TPA: hypothetical protein VFA12_04295 [Stellaceae bacterium]|nr:hypothetical protein [Stellaceae bacterium]